MAFGISRIFRSTDVGAPQHNNAAGSLNAVLKAVLVNGYGSTPSLGWTLEYESGNVMVLRMKGGTKMFIRFDDSLTGELTYVTAYTSMSSVNNGTERMPPVGQNAALRKRQGALTVSVPWVIIGDDAGFWMINKPRYNGSTTDGGQNVWEAIYLGDYVPFDLKNKWNFCMICSYAYGGIYVHGPSTSVNHYIQRDYLFNKGSIPCGIMSNNASYQFGRNYTFNNGVGYLNVLNNGIPIGTKIYLFTSYTYVVFLGLLPGIYDPISTESATSVATTAATVPLIEVTDANGNKVLIFYLSYGTSANSYANQNEVSKAMFTVGEGFRNV